MFFQLSIFAIRLQNRLWLDQIHYIYLLVITSLQLMMNECLSVFDHFVGLVRKRLRLISSMIYCWKLSSSQPFDTAWAGFEAVQNQRDCLMIMPLMISKLSWNHFCWGLYPICLPRVSRKPYRLSSKRTHLNLKALGNFNPFMLNVVKWPNIL